MLAITSGPPGMWGLVLVGGLLVSVPGQRLAEAQREFLTKLLCSGVGLPAQTNCAMSSSNLNKGGWCPVETMYGDIPVDAETREL